MHEPRGPKGEGTAAWAGTCGFPSSAFCGAGPGRVCLLLPLGDSHGPKVRAVWRRQASEKCLCTAMPVCPPGRGS